MKRIDILIKNAMVITVDENRRVFQNGAVAIDKGKIIDVGKTEEITPIYEANKVFDRPRTIVMPGLINTHMHLPQVMMRGLYDDVSDAMTKLKYYTWPIQGCYTADDAMVSAQLGILEMIKSGTTGFISTGLHPRYGMDAIIEMTAASGIRADISKYVMDISDYATDKSALHVGMHEKPDECKAQVLDLVKNWNGAANDRIHIFISPRSVGGVSDDLFRWCVEKANEYDLGLTMHFSEVPNNIDYCLETYGMLPIPFAKKMGLLTSRMTFAHGIWFSGEEIKMVAESGTSIAHCPCCNSKLSMGVAKVSEMLRAGVNVTLANDGMGVNNTADIFREMRTALLLQRVKNEEPNYPTAAQGIEMATINGAKAMRCADKTGSIEKGKCADIILVDADQPHMIPLYDPSSAIAWAANGNDVRDSIIDGKIVMENRIVLTMNEKEILDRAENIKNKITEQAGVTAMHSWMPE